MMPMLFRLHPRQHGRRRELLLIAAVSFLGLLLISSGTTLLLATTPDTEPRRATVSASKRIGSAGIVLPLFDGIAPLGASLILHLRQLGVHLPIEVPHCGDLDPKFQTLIRHHDSRVRIYDICQLAANMTHPRSDEPMFCRDLNHCKRRFRGFEIKILALLLSEFHEVMMLDADTAFFQSPMIAWESRGYVETGTLFFHDRISCDHDFLARRRRNNLTHLEEYLSGFDVRPFENLRAIPRGPPPATPLPSSSSSPDLGANERNVELGFTPSAFLLQSHSWNRRAGHQVDSSLVLWDRRRQPRATAILRSFIALGSGTGRPPSYGDKELYFLACELAETAYAFSDYGVGAIGTQQRQQQRADGTTSEVLCGDAVHYLPELAVNARSRHHDPADPPLLYANSDHVLEWAVTPEPLWRTRARPASLYPGRPEDRGLAQECPFDVEVVAVHAAERARLDERRRIVERLKAQVDMQ